MRRRTLLTVGNEGIKGKEAVAGDICLYNFKTKKLLILQQTKFDSITYPSTVYSPVGVVVVPGSHDVYGTEECAIISMKYISFYTPDTGSVNQDYSVFGGYNIDTPITNFTGTPCVGFNGDSGDENSTINYYNAFGYLPSDTFTAVQCKHDTDVYYYSSGSEYSMVYYTPSPYLTDDSRNPSYYQITSPSSTANSLSDFNGKDNTQVLISLATSQSNWKTASTIENSSGTGYYPAACCCWRYHTDGTSQGDWYLPAMGELGYIMPKLSKVKNSLDKLITVYGEYATLPQNLILWSSTENNSTLVYQVSLNSGCNQYSGKNISDYSSVRPFLRLK